MPDVLAAPRLLGHVLLFSRHAASLFQYKAHFAVIRSLLIGIAGVICERSPTNTVGDHALRSDGPFAKAVTRRPLPDPARAYPCVL